MIGVYIFGVYTVKCKVVPMLNLATKKYKNRLLKVWDVSPIAKGKRGEELNAEKMALKSQKSDK